MTDPIDTRECESNDQDTHQFRASEVLERLKNNDTEYIEYFDALAEYDQAKQQRNIKNFEDKEKLSHRICSILGIEMNGEPYDSLRVMARDHSYALIHYTKPLPENYPYRGIILDVKRGKMVCRSIPYVPEYCIDRDDLAEVLGEDHTLRKLEMRKVFYGVYVRIFYDSGKGLWICSTHRKIDGRNSHWGGESFGNIFSLFFPRKYYRKLNKNCCYVFLMAHPELGPMYENRPPEFRIVDVYDLQNNRRLRPKETTDSLTKLKYLESVRYNTLEELREYVMSMDPYTTIGVLIRTRERLSPNLPCRKVIKVTHPMYSAFRHVIGNEMSTSIRYIELIRIAPKLSDIFVHLAQNFTSEARKIKQTMENAVSLIEAIFRIRYIDGALYNVSSSLHSILKTVKADTANKSGDDKEPFNMRLVSERIAYYLNISESIALVDIIMDLIAFEEERKE